MDIEISIYEPEKGLPIEWGDDCILFVELKNNEVLLRSNPNGLIELAKHLLALAQNDVPNWYHLHYNDSDMLQKNSKNMTISKI